MAAYSTGAVDFAPGMDNDSTRVIASRISFVSATHRRISYMKRRGGAYCACGGQSQTVRISGEDVLIDASSGAVIKRSTLGSCTVIGSGPDASRDYITTEFVDWTDAESKAAIAAWQAGALQIRRTLTKVSGGANSRTPYFRDGYYHDYITIEGTDVPYTDYRARIESFSARRTLTAESGAPENHEGEVIMLSYELSMHDTSAIEQAALALYVSEDAEPTGAEETRMLIPVTSAMLGIENELRLELPGGINSFSAEHDFYLLLRFGCGEEPPDEWRALVTRNMIPIHVSSTNNGVAIGGVSTATQSEKRFEVFFPAIFKSGVAGIRSFSDEEALTGDVWIDDKPIYRRVITATSIPSNATTSIASIAGLDTLVQLCGYAMYGATWVPINYYVTASNYRLETYINNKTLKVTTGSSRAFTRAVFIVEYTKAEET